MGRAVVGLAAVVAPAVRRSPPNAGRDDACVAAGRGPRAEDAAVVGCQTIACKTGRDGVVIGAASLALSTDCRGSNSFCLLAILLTERPEVVVQVGVVGQFGPRAASRPFPQLKAVIKLP